MSGETEQPEFLPAPNSSLAFQRVRGFCLVNHHCPVCFPQEIDDLRKMCDVCGVVPSNMASFMVPALAVFNEIVLLSLVQDKELASEERRKRIEARFKKLEASERAYGKITPLIHKMILQEASSVITGAH